MVEKMPDVMQNVGNSVDWLPDKIAADQIKVLTPLVYVTFNVTMVLYRFSNQNLKTHM